NELLTVRHAQEGRLGGLVFHPRGLWFASVVNGSGQLTAWDCEGNVVFRTDVPENAARMAIRPDGAHLALGEIEGGVVSVRPATAGPTTTSTPTGFVSGTSPRTGPIPGGNSGSVPRTGPGTRARCTAWPSAPTGDGWRRRGRTATSGSGSCGCQGPAGRCPSP